MLIIGIVSENQIVSKDESNANSLVIETLPILDLDHPGANDPAYRKRREEIVAKAIEFHRSNSINRDIALVSYTQQEHEVWKHVSEKLAVLHDKHACSLYKEGRSLLTLPTGNVPQLRDLNRELERISGFQLEPIHGLVSAHEFMMKLSEGVMLCTQYIRHHSKPEFSPEPDIIHEVFGHVPMFVHPEIIALNKLIGNAARRATEEQLLWLNRLYWYSLEYGLIQEHTGVKAFGAGLLGGIKDCMNAFSGNCVIKPFTIKEVIETDYNYSFEQPLFFVIPSLEWLHKEIERFIKSFA
ncbi:hypothetical protein HYV86_00885 [Candidatus Woesearchaeota archaeon]|nr:hypothetical protein [Candidatus Woesearchaeota archaeon]